MGEIRLYAGGLSSSSLSVIAPFIRSNVTINNVTTLRIQADSLGDGGFFVVPFDGYIVSMSVSWRNFNRNFDMNIYVNGPLVHTELSTAANQLLVFAAPVPVLAGDLINMDMAENPEGTGSNNDVYCGLLIVGV